MRPESTSLILVLLLHSHLSVQPQADLSKHAINIHAGTLTEVKRLLFIR